jgi:DNA-binding MarR family transcriptional regulator
MMNDQHAGENRVERVAQLFERLYELSTLQFEHRLRPFELTIPQYLALQAIVRLGPVMPMIAISRAIKTPPSSVTGIANRLVTMDLIARERPPHDRRTVVVSATEAGKSLVASFKAEQYKDLAMLLDGMLPERVEQFTTTLTEFAEGLQLLSDTSALDG